MVLERIGVIFMEWKPLVYKDIDLSDRYMISNTGEIYSIKSQKVLKQTINKSTGYRGVCISLGNRKCKKFIKTHIAVALSFVSGYQEGLIVNHKDGNKQNNTYENLEWVTASENQLHAIKNDLRTNHSKIRCINTGDVFDSVSQACEWCGLAKWSRSIKEYLEGKRNRKSAGKHPLTKEPLQWELV